MMYATTIRSSGTVPLSDITPLKAKLTPGVDVTSSTIYWFRPYLAADFPEVTCDKKYFFIWSTDHDSSEGGVYWGKGDNLDLSDFEELGLIVSGYQAETPFLRRIEGQDEPIYLFFHTKAADPSNNGIQDTKLWTTTGGLLHTATWTVRSNPNGSEAKDQHLGYRKDYFINNTWQTGHLKGVIDLPATLQTYQKSIPSPDGFSLTRGEYFDLTTNISGRRWYVPTFGWFFHWGKGVFWIGTTQTTTPPYSFDLPTFQLVLAKSNTTLDFEREIMVMNGGEQGGTWEVYIEYTTQTAHLYQNNNSNPLKYATFDLKQLKNYAA